MKKLSKNYLKIMIISFIVGIICCLLSSFISTTMEYVVLLIASICFMLSVFILYFIPSFVAINKDHPQYFPIEMLNVFFGWSLLGWVVALVWACMDSNTQDENIVGNKYENLSKLQKLKNDGVITEEEFENEKSKLLK